MILEICLFLFYLCTVYFFTPRKGTRLSLCLTIPECSQKPWNTHTSTHTHTHTSTHTSPHTLPYRAGHFCLLWLSLAYEKCAGFYIYIRGITSSIFPLPSLSFHPSFRDITLFISSDCWRFPRAFQTVLNFNKLFADATRILFSFFIWRIFNERTPWTVLSHFRDKKPKQKRASKTESERRRERNWWKA